ncbi:hypothetical protein [Curvivirga sp.]|uniref:hypothetical protein n=1 Tax=Curvivirga sp. TaxID=2856848 RepID=UPI003B5AFC20
MSDSKNFSKYQYIKWSSYVSRQKREVKDLLKDSENSKDILDVSYIDQLAKQCGAMGRLTAKLYVAYYLLLLLIYSALTNHSLDVEFFGFAIDKVYENKGIIIFLVSILSIITTVISNEHQYLNLILEVITNHKHPSLVARMIRRSKVFSLADNFVGPYIGSNPHPIRFTIVVFYCLIVFFSILLLSFLPILFFIEVVIDIITVPLENEFYHILVLVLVGLAACVHVTEILKYIPTPEYDFDALKEFSKLKEQDENAFSKVVSFSIKKERRWRQVVISTVFVSSASLCLILNDNAFPLHDVSNLSFSLVIVLLAIVSFFAWYVFIASSTFHLWSSKMFVYFHDQKILSPANSIRIHKLMSFAIIFIIPVFVTVSIFYQ